jgi:hypothetical protein
MKTDTEAAVAWAQESGAANAGQGGGGFGGRGGPGGNWAVASLMEPLAEKDLDRAVKLASDQPVSVARGRMIDSLVNQMIAQRGEDTARNSISELADSPFRAGMAERLAQNMADSDPQKTGDWVKTLPAGDTRERALTQLMDTWAGKDLVAAGNYLQSLPASPDLDGARKSYAQAVAKQDPQAAMPWAQTISDPQQQAQAVRQVLGQWNAQDPQAAQQWATSNNVQIPQGGGRGGGNRGNRGGRGGGN